MNDGAIVLGWLCFGSLVVPVFGYFCVQLWTYAYVSARIRAERDNQETKQSLTEGEKNASSESS